MVICMPKVACETQKEYGVLKQKGGTVRYTPHITLETVTF